VEFLLGKDPDLTVKDPIFGATARGAAAYMGNTDIVALIEAHAATGRLFFVSSLLVPRAACEHARRWRYGDRG
jgi:hypothetical protein